MGFNFSIGWGKNSYKYKKDNEGNHVYTLSNIDKGDFISCFDGEYSEKNMIKLFENVPEIFAPINAIADRVTKGIWELVKEGTEDVVTNNSQWNKIKSNPNWKQSFNKFIYNTVVYKNVTGNYYFYKYIPEGFKNKFENIVSLWLLPPQHTESKIKANRPKYYYTTQIQDFVEYYVVKIEDYEQNIYPEYVLHEGYIDIDCNTLKGISPLKAAEYPISNLIAVYKARNAIYNKRGALGAIVNKSTDELGTVALNAKEKKELRDEFNSDFGVTNGKDTIAITSIPIDFVRFGMSIQELMPFEETFADTAAIYSILGVPRSLIPTKEGVTFNNGFTDERKLYADVAIPQAEAIATQLTSFLGLKELGLKIRVRFDHVEALQQDQKINAETQKLITETYTTLYEKGHITKNEMLVQIGSSEVNEGDVYVTDGKNPDPLAIKLGVGGTQALIMVLSDQNISQNVKRNTLISVFGLSEQDAYKLTIDNKPMNQNQNNQIEKPVEDGTKSN